MSTNNQDFKSFREREKIACKHDPFTTETKIVDEKHGAGELSRYFESILWETRQAYEKKQFKSAIKVHFGRFGGTHHLSVEVDSMHGAQRRQESYYLSKPEVQMLIKFLQQIEPEMRDPLGEYVPAKLTKY